jgi:hypothetical protein
MSEPERPGPGGLQRLAGLWYVLLTTYLVGRLVLNRLLLGYWALTAELFALVIVVPVAQLAVLELLRALAGRLRRRGGVPGREPEASS